jgi:hypothetical protein
MYMYNEQTYIYVYIYLILGTFQIICYLVEHRTKIWNINFVFLIINPLETKRKLFYLKAQFEPRSKQLLSLLYKPVSSCYIGLQSQFVL